MVNGTTRSAIAMLSLVACGSAAALGIGEFRAQPLLGQPLNLALPVALGEGESLTSDCASVDVVAGDVKLPPSTVRVRVTQGRENSEAVIRVSTSVPIDEPIINVVVGVGCPTRITRTLVLFADPPLVGVAATTTAASEPPVAAPAAIAAPASAAVARPSAPSGTRASRPAPPSRATRLTQRPLPRSVTPAPEAVASAAATTPSTRAIAAAKPAQPPRGSGRSRLQLDSGQLSATASAAAAQAAEAQASAARLAVAQAEAAASAAQQRMKEMEAEVARLRDQSKAQTDALLALRLQIEQDQAQRRKDAWVLPLFMALAGALALIALWLAWRMRQQQAAPAHSIWWDKAGPSRQPGDDSSFRTSTYKATGQPSTQMPLPSAPAPLSTSGAMADTLVEDPRISPPTVPAPPMPSAARAREEENNRAVSVDEQIDLEQQADFFIALGHDESAIDLLMAHLRSTGGGTPLPFLKLLEIHRRRGDREAYERTRVRFNQRFNSVAPDWTSDPRAGRSLEDYPLVVGRIQHVWPKPLDAMAELESFLFRRGATSEMFDLPAYQEVLFLYQLARDLHQAEQPDTESDVDVLLPIGMAAAPAPPGTIVLRPEFSGGKALSLDLDLGPGPRTESIVTPATPTPDLELEIDPKAPVRDVDADDPWIDDPGDRRRE